MIAVDRDDHVVEATSSISGAVGVTLDVTDEAVVRAMAAEIDAGHGRIDILVGSADISPKKDGHKFYLEEIEASEWRRVLDINLDAMYLIVACSFR